LGQIGLHAVQGAGLLGSQHAHKLAAFACVLLASLCLRHLCHARRERRGSSLHVRVTLLLTR